jgi:hypothetical protein
VAHERAIRPDWSEPGRSAFNLRHELMDLRASPDLLDAAEHRFVRWLEKYAIKGEEVWMSYLQIRRLAGICRRYTNPAEAIAFLERQAEPMLATLI